MKNCPAVCNTCAKLDRQLGLAADQNEEYQPVVVSSDDYYPDYREIYATEQPSDENCQGKLSLSLTKIIQ